RSISTGTSPASPCSTMSRRRSTMSTTRTGRSVHPVEVGIRAPHALFAAGPDAIAAFPPEVEASGLDRIWGRDHVSSRGGQGYEGLLQTAVLSALTRTITVQTAVYLLPLRHPVPVARQVASIAEMVPGRFVFGVGVGGDDRQEPANCGVD